MSATLPSVTKGERVVDELREFLRSYLSQENAMSIRGLAKKLGVSHVGLIHFRDGGGIGMEAGVQLAETIGFNLSKFLTATH